MTSQSSPSAGPSEARLSPRARFWLAIGVFATATALHPYLGLAAGFMAIVLLRGKPRLIMVGLLALLVVYLAVFTPAWSTGQSHSQGGSPTAGAASPP